ncbi:ubiquitin activating enzyme E1 [Dictyostelium discoideum AX4]|uniref:Ubiquitin-like modifier-activating enzyme 1 n=1 Tax=Dictyostelium discoideum TaxID=44689 RepID=UBA1_DICDI|nr:ubiquitin activating enzyme E1 [Dictyostelium discoideum AX4]Q55C16.1 RecName: Full=Ubiquitin-like modifier-activating enzyme 1; AltName: Full=Ubiquitin-activating enzyme E1 [Dictyostelium discoideum]EAL72486.1 ubiquitin activating enzyme E1 [Dictyostelium discoideum AX4]|eukprot:XP_646665.1 ubiquitin activating enzyme E1 [Dictyostelium discoideum AX4]
MSKPMDVEQEPKIDDALYSRQLYALSHETMKKITSTSVLVVGLQGLGIEIVKDLSLAGVKSVTLYDKELVEIKDLSSQFYFSPEQVGKVGRADACFQKVVDLNNYVRIDVHNGELSDEFLKKFNVVVLANQPLALQLKVNEFCHANKIHFISVETRGVFGQLFNDFGEQFTITDTNGENPNAYMISSISQDKEGIVTVVEEQKLQLLDGDLVTFKEVNGMSALNDLPPQKIKTISPLTFSIGDTTNLPPYTSGGYVTEVKQPKVVDFKPLKNILESGENIFITDDFKFTQPTNLLAGFQAIHKFAEKNKHMPRPHNKEDANAVIEIAKGLLKKPDDELDEKMITQLSFGAQGDIVPMQAILGGITAQEVLKACSGKFTPIHQLAFFDSVECLPEDLETLPEEEFQPIGSRYDGQIITFGKTLQNKIENLNYFLVGAGAIGCEMLKNFAMMGLGAGPKGLVHVTDMDTIEKSNLNRQFLFRSSDIQQLKSQTAANAVRVMNPDLNVKAYSLRVGPDTESHYNEEFFNSLDGVCNALDNVEARLYMDSQCVYYGKPLLESGTLGTKGNTQVVVPHLTESYSSSRDPPEKGIPVCTLHNFPNAIEHTIQWARDTFEGLFKNNADNVNSYLTNPAYVQSLKTQNPFVRLETLASIKASLMDRPLDFNQCIAWARLKFEEYFNNNIEQLLYNFPKDMVTTTGTPFWSGPKRAPTPLKFDVENPLHLEFIVAAANLRAFNYGIKAETNIEVIQKQAANVIVPDFTPKKVKIQTSENEPAPSSNTQQAGGDAEDDQCDTILSQLPQPSEMAGYKINSIQFEKDDDTNHHIDFITATSNLRATNYAISPADKHKTKGIAGKIIPALVTTTAVVAGFVCIELIKVIQNKALEKYKSTFMNLGIPFFGFVEPIAAPKNKIREGWTWTLWDRFDVDGDITLKEFLDLFEKKHGLDISMLSCKVTLLYALFTDKKTKEERLKMKISQLYETLSKKPLPKDKKYLLLEICCNDTETGDDVDVPSVRYKYN